MDTTERPSSRLYSLHSKLTALGWMLHETLWHSGGVGHDYAVGITSLIEEQTETIKGVADDIASHEEISLKLQTNSASAQRIAAQLCEAIKDAADLKADPKGMRYSIVTTTFERIENAVVGAFELAGIDSVLAQRAIAEGGRLRPAAYLTGDRERMDADQTTRALGRTYMTVDPETAARIMREDAEQDALNHQSAELEAELAGNDPQLTPEELREKFIADQLRRGVGVSDLASALNMKKAAVESLAAKLTGRKPDDPAGDRAVNQ